MATPGAAMAAQDAQLLAAKGLIYIANDQELLGRFMNLAGLVPGDFRAASGEPEFLAGVLSFLMDHEAVLLAFAASADISPHRVASAHLALSGAPAWDS
jgi:hypothetical protein